MTAPPLRVAVVARAVMPLHGVGGLERSVRDLVCHLAARGVHVTLITPPPLAVLPKSVRDPFASPLITVRHVPYVTFPFANRRGTTILDRSTAYLVYGTRAGRLALTLARAREIDIVHGFGASVLGYARPRTLALRGDGRAHPDASAAPLVLNPQGLEEFGATAAVQPRLKRLGYGPLRWAVRRCARAADRIIATDASLVDTVVRHLAPREDQVEVIPNGIDLVEAGDLAGPADGHILRQRLGWSAGELVLLSAGRLEQNKGFDLLARALAGPARADGPLAAGGWRWVIVGSGPFRREIEAAVAEHGLERHTTFTGRVSERELHAWYEACSIFVHPTRYEGSSLVTLEAMAHRKPVIATRAGGLPDKVRPGVNGWLVEPEDARGLAAAVEDAASRPDRLPWLGQNSRMIVEQEFAWTVLIERQVRMYEELLARR
jgi:glycosyltransferase involved in cell wall biosynthesis